MKKILIIEDEKTLREVLAKKIKTEGFQVEEAEDGEDGISKINSFKPDLIMLDMLLPKKNGYEVLEYMKKNKKKIPTIIISNSGQPVDISKAIKLGASDYIVKAELNPNEIIEKAKPYLTEAGDNKRILLIEDEEFLSKLCSKKLRTVGFSVDTASDGELGLKKIIETKPDLVLLDIILPGMQGFDVLSQTRASKDSKIKNIPIIMLSNLGQDSDIEKAKDLGANDFLVKAHFTTEEIVTVVNKYLKK